MTAVIVGLVILGILELLSLAELCVLSHRVHELSNRPKYEVKVNLPASASHLSSVTEEAMREAMLRRPS